MAPVIVLHVEDDPSLREFVGLAFENLGFQGEILKAASVAQGLEIIRLQSEKGRPLDLIIVDMNLPDGKGIEIVNQVKRNPAWTGIPTLMLSSETDATTVAEAYALGANCFLPKNPSHGNLLDVVESLYHFWLEQAIRAKPESTDPMRELLGQTLGYKAQMSQAYLRMAKMFTKTINHAEFFLNLSLSQSNHANLIAFLRNPNQGHSVPDGLSREMRQNLSDKRTCLLRVEGSIERAAEPSIEDAYRWCLELEKDFNPDVLRAALCYCVPNAAAGVRVFKKSVAGYLAALSNQILSESRNSENRAAAGTLQSRAITLLH